MNIQFSRNLFMCTLLAVGTVQMEEFCNEETFNVTDSLQVIWKQMSVSNGIKYISSTCLDESKRLLLRQCSEITGWLPNYEETKAQCKSVIQEPKQCPTSVQTIVNSTDICEHNYYDQLNMLYGTSLTFLDLDINERTLLIKNYIHHNAPDPIRFPVYNMWPNEPITSDVDYTIEDVELQLTVPGKYGVAVRFSNNSVPVLCTHDIDCDQMCLALKIDRISSSAQLVIAGCSSPGPEFYYSVVSRKADMIKSYACMEGYYRYIQLLHTTIKECFSVKKFHQKVLVTNVTDAQAVIDSYCNGNMMDLMSNDHHLMFMHLSQSAGLNGSDRCLFRLQSRNVIRYSEWDTLTHSVINFINWDPFMDHETILNNQHSILTIDSAGKWTWAFDSITCIVCMDSVPILQPSLDIKFNLLERRVEVHATNQDFLFRYADEYVGFQCYALIDYSNGDVSVEYKTELKINTSHRSISEYFVENVGVGIYWCAGQKIYATDILIETEKIFAYFPIFVVRVEQKCSNESDADNLINDLLAICGLDSCSNPITNVASCGVASIYRRDANSTTMFTVRLSVHLYDEPMGKDSIISLTNEQLYTFRVYEKLLSLSYHREINVISVRSIDLCLHDSMASLELVIWGVAHVGESVSPPICNFQANVSLSSRICSGYEETGAMWEEQTDIQCYSPVSHTLFELFVSFDNVCQISDVITNITKTIDDFDGTLFPVDVFAISKIIEKIANILNSNQISLELNDLRQIFNIFNNVSAIDDHLLAITSNLNVTNKMLENLDELLLGNMQHPIDVLADGITSIETPSLLNYLTEPVVSGISGVALFSDQANSLNNFTGSSARFIYQNETLLDFIYKDGFVVGAKVPEEILATQSKISFTIFSNDRLFHSSPGERNFRVNGKIISISLCCSLTPFPTGSVIQIFFKLSNETSESICTYWDFMLTNGWSADGCQFGGLFDVNGGRVVLCNCSHLTHFGNVLNDGDGVVSDQRHETVLNIITLVGCSLSSVGVLGVYLTAITFSNWCQKSSAKIILHFATSILLQMVLMLMIDIDDNFLSKISGNRSSCISMAVGLHYSVLANFFWMLIISYFQFQRYVIVFNKYYVKRIVLKSALIGWGCPVIPIAIVLLCNCTLYIPSDRKYFCYPTGRAFYFGLVLPLGLIILGNSVVFLSVLCSIFNGAKNLQAGGCMKEDLRLLKLRLLVFLFFVLGMTWIFGFLSGIGKRNSLIFTYLFCISATMQGFVLFLYCIILDTGSRNLWANLIRKYWNKIC